MGTGAENQEGVLQLELAAEGSEGPSQTSDMPGLTPEDLLKQEQAKAKLRELQVREVADLLPLIRLEAQAVKRLLVEVLEEVRKTLSQTMELHELMIQDAETQFEVTQTFQRTLIVLDQVNEEKTPLSATTVLPTPPKKRS